MSPSVGRRSPVRDRSDSPARGRRSPRRRSPSRRERSPLRRRSSPRARSPVGTSSRARSPAKEKEKPLSRARSPKRPWSSSPTSGSPSPRIKRLRRAQMEKEGDRVSDRECGRNSGREVDKERDSREVDRVSDRERVRNSNREVDKERCNREISVDRSDRRSARGKKEVDRVSDREREKNITREGDRERHNREVSVDRNERRSRHQRSASPVGRGYSNRHSSHSPSRVARGGVHDEVTIRRGEDDRDDNDSVARMKAAEESLEAKEKQKPSFELSGKLAAETNRVKGVTLLFNEPSDARKPDVRWRLYVFKGGEVLNEPLYIHRQSCYLFGRERRVADIPTDHPSCSKQHAVIQFRQVEVEKADGMLSKQVRPYLMDLGSTNETFINDNRIEPQRYYELFEKDTIKFGNSSREYVILHENSA